MKLRTSPAARVRAPGGRRLWLATAAIVPVAVLTACGATRADPPAPAPAQVTAEAKTSVETAPPAPRTADLPTPPVSSTLVVQRRLASLGYLPADAATGIRDVRTTHAVLAFQAWEGLARDGIVGPQTAAALEKASRPVPAGNAGDRHVEVHRGKGVTFLVDRGRVLRTIHSSSGAGADETPAGSYSVFCKELSSWSVPYRVWLPYASYFNGGIAFHGHRDVPSYPASHGCVRLPSMEAPGAYAFMSIGTPVSVY